MAPTTCAMRSCSSSSSSSTSSSSLRASTSTPFISPRSSRSIARPRAYSVVAQANLVKPPAGVTQPPKQPEVPPATFGFVTWAEKINSRAAMIGFFALLALEAATGKGLLELLGWNVGSGLGFEL